MKRTYFLTVLALGVVSCGARPAAQTPTPATVETTTSSTLLTEQAALSAAGLTATLERAALRLAPTRDGVTVRFQVAGGYGYYGEGGLALTAPRNFTPIPGLIVEANVGGIWQRVAELR